MIKLLPKQLNCHYIAILACSVVTHGLLLLNDGVYWDGWLIYTSLIEKNWNSLHLWFTEAGGVPTTLCFHWLLGYFPGVIFGYRVVAFVSITFSGVLVYVICNELGLVSRLESLLIALLSMSYPAFQVSAELITTPIVFYYCLFLLACLLTIKTEKTNRISHYFLRIFSLVLFVLSFTINSLLVFYFCLLLVLVWHTREKRSTLLRHVFTRFLPRRLDYVLLPVLYWGIIRFFFPTHGLYSRYNQIALSPSTLVEVYVAFTRNAVYGQLDDALMRLIDYPVLGLLVLLAVQWAYFTFSMDSVRPLKRKTNAYALLFFGLMLLVLGIFPYAAVGLTASLHGWNTRHALLVALPMAISFVAVARLSFIDKTGSISKSGLSFLMVLVLVFALSTIRNYISWQARWVKDRSIMTNLAEVSNAADGVSVFWVDDRFQVGGEGNYRFYEWASIFKSVWGDESRIGLDQRHYTPDFLTTGLRFFNGRYNLSDFDPAGCQAVLAVRRGSPSYSDAELATRYLFYRFFRRDKLTEFLPEVTDVQVQPISAPEAVNCPMQ